MRVLVTGAGGTLGQALAPALALEGHEPVLLDVRTLETPYRFVEGDVRQLQDVRRAMQGVDLVVHGAALHGIHLRDHTSQEFHELNVTGTFNTWEAAAEAGVRGLVFCSTMGVYGESRLPSGEDEVVALREDLPLLPADIYGLTKTVGEEMCRYYGRRHGIGSIALRYGMFVPEPFFRYGIRLLYGGVDTADVVGSVLAAIDALAARRVNWGAFNVHSVVPFTEEDAAGLLSDPLAVIDRYWPGASQLLWQRGVERLEPIREYYPMGSIQHRLGFRPSRNFDQWLKKLESQPEALADKPSPWP
ncbi:MAG: NAD(P)-dependent oxidoreductase [Chloroflexi bacterium]|nr:NAD(P)-dependent oxidoreductase [Chloroflexota bacterium]MDQ3407255.1 NAD(P)-dependent oxidoreductase [Chloroflexota bacterium]